ncbi:hypothetical protein LMG28727_02310 [Paraburkholderia kirstenboschensis]|nr:hypothetical protein LMG28727_02310 [Paraburkholderia kirstenboschensis]
MTAAQRLNTDIPASYISHMDVIMTPSGAPQIASFRPIKPLYFSRPLIHLRLVLE